MCGCARVRAWQHSAGRKTGSTAVGSRNSGADQSPGGWHYGRSAIVYSPATSPFWQSEVSMCACVCVRGGRVWDRKSWKIQSWRDRVWERKDTRPVYVCVCVSLYLSLGRLMWAWVLSDLSVAHFRQVHRHGHAGIQPCTHTHTQLEPQTHIVYSSNPSNMTIKRHSPHSSVSH